MLKTLEVAETFPGLPETSFAILPSDGRVIRIQRGERGYYPTSMGPENAEAICESLNKESEVTKAQAEAMFVGSLFGWDAPGSNPAVYNEDGTVKREVWAELACTSRVGAP